MSVRGTIIKTLPKIPAINAPKPNKHEATEITVDQDMSRFRAASSCSSNKSLALSMRFSMMINYLARLVLVNKKKDIQTV